MTSTEPLGAIIRSAPAIRAGARDLPVLSMTMHSGLMDQGQKFKKRVASADTSDYKVVRAGQLVVGFPIDEGVLDFQELYDEAMVSPAYGIWDLRKPEQIYIPYLRRFLRSPQALSYYKAKLRGSTARRRSLPADTFLALPIPLPSYAEQRRLAAVLDRVDQLRARRQESRTALSELASTIFIASFGSGSGWPAEPLGSVAQFYAGSSLRESIPFQGQTGGFLMMKVSDMNAPGNEREIRRSALWSSTPGANSATCPAGSVVIPKRGGAIGTNKKRVTVRPTVLDPNLMAIAPESRLHLSYLYHWFQHFDLASITSGSSVPQLNKQDLAPLPIPVPPLREQQVFETRMATIERLRDQMLAHGSKLDLLFSSLQMRAFSGRL